MDPNGLFSIAMIFFEFVALVFCVFMCYSLYLYFVFFSVISSMISFVVLLKRINSERTIKNEVHSPLIIHRFWMLYFLHPPH